MPNSTRDEATHVHKRSGCFDAFHLCSCCIRGNVVFVRVTAKYGCVSARVPFVAKDMMRRGKFVILLLLFAGGDQALWSMLDWWELGSWDLVLLRHALVMALQGGGGDHQGTDSRAHYGCLCPNIVGVPAIVWHPGHRSVNDPSILDVQVSSC